LSSGEVDIIINKKGILKLREDCLLRERIQ